MNTGIEFTMKMWYHTAYNNYFTKTAEFAVHTLSCILRAICTYRSDIF